MVGVTQGQVNERRGLDNVSEGLLAKISITLTNRVLTVSARFHQPRILSYRLSRPVPLLTSASVKPTEQAALRRIRDEKRQRRHRSEHQHPRTGQVQRCARAGPCCL